MAGKKIRVKLSGDDAHTAYIYLPGHPDPPQPDAALKTISLDELVNDFRGPRVNLDFDKDGVLIGIEVLG